MVEELVFYTNPQSRGRIARWMLEEVGCDYRTEVVDYAVMKGEAYRAVNPMGKVPAIKHQDKVVTEVAAICCYLADAFPEADLAPPTTDRADYYRWIFFAAGPLEAAITAKSMGWDEPGKSAQLGYGTYDTTIDTLEKALTGKDYITGRFSAADLLVGAYVNFYMNQFKIMEPRPVFAYYAARMTDRDAFRRASAIDGKLIAEAQAKQQETQPA